MFGNTAYDVIERGDYRFVLREGKAADPAENQQLVLLHGMFGGLSNFDPLLDEMDENVTCFIPEIPLYELPSSSMKVSKLAEWLKKVLVNEGIEETILLGNSLGGHIALDFTLQNPQQVEALVLTGSSGLFENHFGNSTPRRFDREYIRQRAGETFYHDILNDTIIDEIMAVLKNRKKLKNLLRLARATHKYNMEHVLGQIEHRTLLVWGKNDEITPPDVGEMFQSLMPNAKLEWIDECGHAPMMEHPKEFTVILTRFLNELKAKKSRKTEL